MFFCLFSSKTGALLNYHATAAAAATAAGGDDDDNDDDDDGDGIAMVRIRHCLTAFHLYCVLFGHRRRGFALQMPVYLSMIGASGG